MVNFRVGDLAMRVDAREGNSWDEWFPLYQPFVITKTDPVFLYNKERLSIPKFMCAPCTIYYFNKFYGKL